MSKAKFILKEPNSKSESLIYLVYNYQYKRFKYSTGEKIAPQFWNPKTQRAKESRKFPEYPEFNARLDKFSHGISTAFRKLLNDGIQPSNAILKKALEEELSDNILQPNKVTLIQFIEDLIIQSASSKKIGTIKVYKTSLKHLKSFVKNKNITLDFDTINIDFYNQYVHYLSTEKNLSANTVGKHIKTLKSFLSEATERGLNTNLEFKKSKFKTLREDADTVYLSIDELKKVEQMDLSSSPRLQKVKDLFLIGCYTGLRFSDFTQIKPENISESKSHILIRTQKTGQRVTIPLHPVVKNIILKYSNELPKAYANQVMNKYLKEVMSIAGFKEPIETTITRGGVLEKKRNSKVQTYINAYRKKKLRY